MGCVNSTEVEQQGGLNVVPSGHTLETVHKKQFHEEYVLKRKLGKGAFAQVNLAQRVSDGVMVAVKITDLSRPKAEGGKEEIDTRIVRNTEKEAALLRKVRGRENCVCFFEAYTEGLLSYIVMERCDVTFLRALESSSQLTENTLAKFFKDMFQALDCVHKASLVHRDVKPDNFLCSGEGLTVKLCDFGLAEVLPNPSAPAELKGVYGTAPFMSPEMLGPSGYGAATDIWSLGVVLYVLLFGSFPYTPIEATAKAMKAAIISGVPPPPYKPKKLVGDGSPYLTAEIMTFLEPLLERKKEMRPTAEEALAMPWLAEDRGANPRSLPSLRPMLHAAKRSGAFDTRANGGNDKTHVDSMLSNVVQAKSTGDDRRSSVGTRGSSDEAKVSSLSQKVKLNALASHVKLNKPHADISWEALHKCDRMDPAMVQSGGGLSTASQMSTATGLSATSHRSKSSRHGQRSLAASREA